MAEPNWTKEAEQLSADIVRTEPNRRRGVVRFGKLSGVAGVFVPDADAGRLTQALTKAGIAVLGTGSTLGHGGQIVAMIVRATNLKALEAIVGE